MKKNYLEFIRGMAALFVVVFHYLVLHSLKTGTHSLFKRGGVDSVMIFFILSGCVINMTQTLKPKTIFVFLRNRILRIYPEFVVGLLLGIIVILLVHETMPPFSTLVGNLFMVSTDDALIVQTIPSNAPLWSLTYEMFFYIIFALGIGRFHKKFMTLWLLIALLMFIPYYQFDIGKNIVEYFIKILSFSTLWLIGYYIYEYRKLFYADLYTVVFCVGLLPLISRTQLTEQYSDPLKYLIFALTAVPVFRFCLQEPPEGKRIKLIYLVPVYLIFGTMIFMNSDSGFAGKIFYSILPLMLILFIYLINKLKLKERFKKLIQRSGSIMGKYSYAIYITHFPILVLCTYYISNFYFYLIVSLFAILIFSYLLESVFQPAIVKLFKRPV